MMTLVTLWRKSSTGCYQARFKSIVKRIYIVVKRGLFLECMAIQHLKIVAMYQQNKEKNGIFF